MPITALSAREERRVTGMPTTEPPCRVSRSLVCRSLLMRLTLGVMKVNLLLVLLFALVFNWPIFLHFYRILSALEHVKAGFALSIPLVLVAALNAVFLPFTFRYLLKPFFILSDRHRLPGQLRHAQIRHHLRCGHGAEHTRNQQRGGKLLPQWFSGALVPADRRAAGAWPACG